MACAGESNEMLCVFLSSASIGSVVPCLQDAFQTVDGPFGQRVALWVSRRRQENPLMGVFTQ